jgi:hypothetical protein
MATPKPISEAKMFRKQLETRLDLLLAELHPGAAGKKKPKRAVKKAARLLADAVKVSKKKRKAARQVTPAKKKNGAKVKAVTVNPV